MSLSKWAIQRTAENAKELNAYFGQLYNRKYTYEYDSYEGKPYYMHYPMVGAKVVLQYVHSQYVLISFEDFKSNYKQELMSLKVTDLKVGVIYHCQSSTRGFTQLIRYLGAGKIDTNVDITNPDNPIRRNDKFIKDNSKWTIREATGYEVSIFKNILGEVKEFLIAAGELIVHVENYTLI